MSNHQSKSRKEQETHSDIEEKVIYINRCSKVVKGGRKFSFSALVIAGDGKGNIGIGFEKANEVSDAIRKGSDAARRDLKPISLEGTTIPHVVTHKHDGAKVLLMPANKGTGLIAGAILRAILRLAGVEDVVAKSFGSSNPMNQVHAAVAALRTLRSRNDILQARGSEV